MSSFFHNMYKASYWDYDAIFPERLDYCIVGAGFTGIGMAMGLREKLPDAHILIIEQLPMGTAASTKNAGFLCFGSPSEVLDAMTTIGEKDAMSDIRKRWEGAAFLKHICKKLHIPIGMHGAYEIIDNEEIRRSVLQALPAINRLLADISPELVWESRHVTWTDCREVLFCQAEGQIHPGMLWNALKKHLRKLNIEIVQNCTLSDYQQNGNCVEMTINDAFHTDTRKLILTTNAFQENLDDVRPARNIVTLYKADIDMKSNIHYDKGYVYMRALDGYFLVGGGRNIDAETEAHAEFGSNEKILHYLRGCKEKLLNFELPDKPVWQWSGIITSGKDGNPLIEKLDKNILYTGRYGGMGVARALHHGYSTGKEIELE